jgi:hypothetical protein
MFGEQPPSALLRPSARLPASAPPSRPSTAPSGHSAPLLWASPTTSYSPTPFAENVTYNINSLYEHAREKRRKDKSVPPLFSTTVINGTNMDSSSTASCTGSTTGLINDFKEQERGWRGTARRTTRPEDTVFDIGCMDEPSAPLHKRSPHSSRVQPPLPKGRHSAQFVHYKKSFKSLAMIYNQVCRLPVGE